MDYNNLDFFGYNDEQRKLLGYLRESRTSGKKVVLMTAPSFVVDFHADTFVQRMRGLGFDVVTELTFGAKMVNKQYHDYIKKHKKTHFKFISSACPASVMLVRSKYPGLSRFLMPFDSPMIAMAKIVNKVYPNHRIVFLSPCFAKRAEAQNYPWKGKKLIDGVITFSELKQIVAKEKPLPLGKHTFDSFYDEATKIYPLSGGMSATLNTKGILTHEDMIAEDGVTNLTTLFSRYPNKTFYDILFCAGGCIGGPSIASWESIPSRKEKVMHYRELHKRKKTKKHKKLPLFVKRISFNRAYT